MFTVFLIKNNCKQRSKCSNSFKCILENLKQTKIIVLKNSYNCQCSIKNMNTEVT